MLELRDQSGHGPLNFSHIPTDSTSIVLKCFRFNLPIVRTNYKSCNSFVQTGMYLKSYAFVTINAICYISFHWMAARFNTEIYKKSRPYLHLRGFGLRAPM